MTTYHETQGLNPWLIRLPLLMISGVALLIMLLAGFVFGVQQVYAESVMPGVWVGGVNLGGLTRTQAIGILDSRLNYDQDAVFTFRYGDEIRPEWQFTAGELGVTYDLDATINAAMQSGRGGSLLANLAEQASIWLSGQEIPLRVTYDETIAADKLTAIAETINRPAQDATLTIEGLSVTTTPATMGQTVDVAATLDNLTTRIRPLDTGGEIPLVIVEDAPLIVDTEAAANKARAALSAPLSINADSPDGQPTGPWVAMPEQIATLLTRSPVYNEDGTVRYEIDINIEAFRDFMTRLAPTLETQAQNGRFHFDDDTRQLEVFQLAVNGRQMNVDETLRRLEAAVFNADPAQRQVYVAYNYVLPDYHNDVRAGELGITELVSESTTYYTGSTANRIQNIIESARRFDGVIIAPGEEFSYNEILGDISPEEGFTEGFVIVGDRTLPGVGGGVCQVSTTAFQAAFYAGYPIAERWTHGYRVGYYEQGEGVGMDAVIYQGDPGERSLDFRFVNDTDYHLLIETAIFPGDDAVQFRFYSTNPGRQVVKNGPQISNISSPPAPRYVPNADLAQGQEHWLERPSEGAFVVVNRTILDSNGNELDSTDFRANYRAWGALIEVSPGDTRLTS